MSKSKAKGTAAETKVVRYLLSSGFPNVERRALNGTLDKGDVAGIPGVVIEVKAAKDPKLATWKRETLTEMANAGAALGLLIVKREFKPVHQWDAYVPARQLGFPVAFMPEGEEWIRMDLVLAVAYLALQTGLSSRSNPSSPTTA